MRNRFQKHISFLPPACVAKGRLQLLQGWILHSSIFWVLLVASIIFFVTHQKILSDGLQARRGPGCTPIDVIGITDNRHERLHTKVCFLVQTSIGLRCLPRAESKTGTVISRSLRQPQRQRPLDVLLQPLRLVGEVVKDQPKFIFKLLSQFFSFNKVLKFLPKKNK